MTILRRRSRPVAPALTAALGRLPLLAIAVIAAGLFTAPAAAQRVSDIFPAPISGADVDEIAARLGMSDLQRLAVDPDHAQYLDAYRQLREEEYEPFLRSFMRRWTSFISDPDSEAVKDIIRTISRGETQLKTIDDRFFAALDGVLSDSQRARMPLVLQRRELDRTKSGILQGSSEGIPALTLELGRMVERADLEPAVMDQLEPLIRDYESRVSTARRRLRDRAERAAVDIVEAAAELLKRALSGELSAEEGQDIWEQMRGLVYEKGKPILGDTIDLVQMNARTIDQWRPLLPPELADRIELYFLNEGHGEFLQPLVNVVERFDLALRLPDLPSGLRADLEARRAAADRDMMLRARRTVRMMYDFIADASFILADGETEEMMKIEEVIEDLQEDARTAREQLDALLGERLVERLGLAESEGGPVAAPADPIERLLRARPSRLVIRQPDVKDATSEIPVSPSAGPFVPGPIAARELAWYAEILELGEFEREIVDTLHADYLMSFDDLVEDAITPLTELHEAASRSRGRGEEPDPAKGAEARAAFSQIPAARQAALDAIAALDEEFMLQISATVLDASDPENAELLDLVRSSRDRIRGGASGRNAVRGWASRMTRGRGNDTAEGYIDLELLIFEAGLEGDARATAQRTIDQYRSRRVDVLRTLRDAWISHTETMLDMSLARWNGGEGEFDWQRVRTSNEALADARRRVVRLNRLALEQLDGRLSRDAAARVTERYHRIAFPDVWSDDQAAERPILAALALEDLRPDQREQLAELSAMYRPRYRDLNSAIVTQRMREMNGEGPAQWQSWMARADRIDQHRFDRSELNGRALRALRSILEPTQRVKVGFADAGA